MDLLKEHDPSATVTNGGPKCNGFHPFLSVQAPPTPPPALLSLPHSVEEVSSLTTCTSQDSPSETTSCTSYINSEESCLSHVPPPPPIYPSARQCNGDSLNLTMSRQEKRSMKRRKSRQTELQFSAMPTLQQLLKGNKEIGGTTTGVTAVSGHV